MKAVRFSLIPVLLVSVLVAGSHVAAAADFPPVTDAERALTAVPGEPNAPAVVLFKKAEFLMMGYGVSSGASSSHLTIQARVKILTEEGKSNGEIAISHSDFTRLRNFQARTVLPDGRVVPVPPDAKFLRKESRSKKFYTTAVAFPAVEVGAILDYRYELVFDSIYYLEPWYFSEDVPVRYAEIVFKTPSDLGAHVWNRSSSGVKIQTDRKKSSVGYETRAWAENLPSVADDPYGPPFTDLATQMLLLPAKWSDDPLMESWPKTCELLEKQYDFVRHRDAGLAAKAREIAGSGSPRQKAEALYRFVRDEVETEPYIGVIVDPDASLAKILEKRQADRAEKALLLQSMLRAVKIESRLVWAGDRSRGTMDPQLPNPNWFDTVLVMLDLDGQRTFLDPTDRALGFGHLRPGYEGTPALIHDRKKPEGIVLPETPFEQNLQRAEVDLILDESGRLTGTGTLTLTGHHAWEKIDWQEDEAQTVQAWKNWLVESYRGFEVSDVKVVESPDERKVTLTWAVAEREEEVLGDEATVVPSLPLGPLAQPFVQAAGARRSAVMFDFPDRDEVELRLRWPEGWTLDSLPKGTKVDSTVGALASGAEVKEGERSLVYRRRLDLTRRVLGTSQEYEAVRSLFAEVEKSDAQALLLVRR
jgi:transglutaminase-like putative cysteine protease